jgi:uncharacterized protein (DUF1499 family)
MPSRLSRRSAARGTASAAARATARGLAIGLVLAAALAVALLAAGRAGWLAGSPPPGLGLQAGRLAAPSLTPNSISSQARWWPQHPRQEQAHIDPLPAPDGARTWQQLGAWLDAAPGVRVLQREPHYLRVEFHTRWLGFVDDGEFWWDEASGLIHVRSASRLGHDDLGTNRRRIEALRTVLDTAARD